MQTHRTYEPQYEECLELRDRQGLTSLGIMSNQVWYDDPRRLAFLLARYKFVAKMFSGFDRVLEVGCADAFGTRVVLQEVRHLTAVDVDPVFVQDATARMDPRWRFDCLVHDILAGPVAGRFDGAYALDVLEHFKLVDEATFLRNISDSLTEHGTLILGVPSLESQSHASSQSKAGHINCKSGVDLKALLRGYYHNVFVFSMNDEVVHTGFYPMANYLIALCCGRK